MLKTKIQALVVTSSSIDYPGSIALPGELLRAAGIKPFELVHVNNRSNGNRIITYAVKSSREGVVTVNGAASRLFSSGDVIHVLAFAYLEEQEAAGFCPTLVVADENNKLVRSGPYELH